MGAFCLKGEINGFNFFQVIKIIVYFYFFIFLITFHTLGESLFVSILYAIGGGITLTIFNHLMLVVLWFLFWRVIVKFFEIVKISVMWLKEMMFMMNSLLLFTSLLLLVGCSSNPIAPANDYKLEEENKFTEFLPKGNIEFYDFGEEVILNNKYSNLIVTLNDTEILDTFEGTGPSKDVYLSTSFTLEGMHLMFTESSLATIFTLVDDKNQVINSSISHIKIKNNEENNRLTNVVELEVVFDIYKSSYYKLIIAETYGWEVDLNTI